MLGDRSRPLPSKAKLLPIAHAPDVALGGYLLQGGFGWGSRELGLATENVIGLDLILADGSQIFASESQTVIFSGL